MNIRAIGDVQVTTYSHNCNNMNLASLASGSTQDMVLSQHAPQYLDQFIFDRAAVL